MKRTVSLGLVFFLFFTFSCQSMQYGPAVSARGSFMKGANPANQEFEAGEEEEKNKIGMWIFVGIAAAAGVGAAVVVPMAINGKL